MKNYFRFLFNKNGDFYIDRISDTGLAVLQPWKSTDLVQNGWAKIAVMNLGKLWHFFINDKEVYKCSPQPFFGQKVGFFVNTNSALYCHSLKIYDWDLDTRPAGEKEPIYDLRFHDDLVSNENNWGTINDNDVTTNFSSTGFEIKSKYTGYYMSWQSMRAMEFLHHDVELGMRHTGGVDDYGHGLVFGAKDINNAWVFMISHDGSFQVGSFIDGSWHAIKEWTKSDAVRTFYNAPNYLKYEKVNGKWNFYINNVLVYSCPSKTHFGDRFGCFVENKQTVEFMNFKVRMISFP